MKKIKIRKPKPVAAKSSPEQALSKKVDEQAELVATVEETIASLKLQVLDAKRTVNTLLNRRVEEAFGEVADFNRKLELRLLREVYRFLKVAPIWEVILIKEVGVLNDYETLKKYYDQGYSVLGFSYNPSRTEAAGMMMHRPCPPKTEDEFLEMFECFKNGATMNSTAKTAEPKVVTVELIPEKKPRKRKTKS